ncbi:MAG: alpha/beta fold hydrolase [Desulfuromonadaceae bacterium]|nr:alpha/beta fold hydrolase [Desulfuromonas sp.]MDY0185804.1 alpha/beta fold hydrolase [Desulfuromonadaceae bacterium]
MSTSFWVGTAIIVAAALFVLGVSFKNSRQLLFNPEETRQARYQAEPEKLPHQRFNQHGVAPSTLNLQTEDGVKLKAWYVPSTAGATIILLHGYKMDSGEMASIAAMLVRHGFGFIAPDLRAHGDSEGELITFGQHELLDVKAAADYIANREPDNTFGILGNSMGGALSLCYAAQDDRIQAVAAQSPYASVRHSLKQGIKHFTGLPPFPFVPLIRMFSLPYVDLDNPRISPLAMMPALKGKSVLIMMGGADMVVEPQGAEQLFRAGGETTRLWFEPELTHVAFHIDMPEQFERNMVEFFSTSLLHSKD